ncbi:M23 family metallopeptidase [uncultured Tenacibaculum sp.]|uniref:M23 family metallopeptidase n=1 Tax=uncultured Tenacibaculum sp. TaxID=174713 RepID=UPI00260A8EB3|nr:M23 family metallopeptidase [uncultured Tenacibaculum sp.]
MKHYYTLILLFVVSLGFAQKKYSKSYFAKPMGIPVVVAGTFGELRSNHFHSGIDLKTQQKEGIPILAPANGYVFRIKVAQYGFGKVLYVKHPSGHTTVFAHLQRFAPKIQKYVKSIQYKKKSYYTGNLFPDEEKFPVKKGEIIGYSGDTGSSGGPHLHYEIRDSKTDRIINPLHFGLEVKDTRHPIIEKLMAFPLDSAARVNNSNLKSVIPIKKLENGKYVSERILANGTIGLGVSTFDRQDGAMNRNGIYSLEMHVNGQRVYYHDVETFSFAESKYINLLIDYDHYGKYKKRFQKTHRVSKNKLSLYENLVNEGRLTIEPFSSYNIEIIAKDFNGNASTLRIPIKGVAQNKIETQKDTTNYKITAANFNKFEQDGVSIAFPKKSFYHDCYLDFEVKDGIAKIHEPTIPLDKRFTLTFNTSHLTATEKQQVYIANVTKKKYPKHVSTKKKENKVYTNQKTLGSYTLKFDSIKPKISLINFADQQWITKNKTLKVKIKDEESGIKDFRGYIDNEWILMEYNHKKGILTYDFSDKKLVGSKHIFKIVVSDNVGNTETISKTFYRKP